MVVTALLGLRDGVAFEGTAKLAWINVTVRPRVSHLPPGVGLKISLDHVQCHLDLQQLPAHGVRGGRELIGLTVAKEQFDLGLESAEQRGVVNGGGIGRRRGERPRSLSRVERGLLDLAAQLEAAVFHGLRGAVHLVGGVLELDRGVLFAMVWTGT